MRRLLTVAFCAGALLVAPIGSAFAADNGGDNGWGNCGHNSSAGAQTSTGPNAPGNGGYHKGDLCGQSSGGDQGTGGTGSTSGTGTGTTGGGTVLV